MAQALTCILKLGLHAATATETESTGFPHLRILMPIIQIYLAIFFIVRILILTYSFSLTPRFC